MKREGELKSAFATELKRQLPLFIILLHSSRAAPDRSITGNGKTTWWEFKHATPDFDSPGDQVLMCMRLAANGFCRYVIWWETSKGTDQKTMIVHPTTVFGLRSGEPLVAEAFCEGFDHKWLTEYIKKIHQQ